MFKRMKKIIAVIAAVFAFAAVAAAQPRTIGIRGTFGGELSYQHTLGANFAEADLGWSNDGIYVTGTYNFVFASEGDFNFYAGPGAALGIYNNGETSGLNLGIAGVVGAEYNFSIPMTISLDWRPCFNFLYGGFGYNGFGLALRYRF